MWPLKWRKPCLGNKETQTVFILPTVLSNSFFKQAYPDVRTQVETCSELTVHATRTFNTAQMSMVTGVPVFVQCKEVQDLQTIDISLPSGIRILSTGGEESKLALEMSGEDDSLGRRFHLSCLARAKFRPGGLPTSVRSQWMSPGLLLCQFPQNNTPVPPVCVCFQSALLQGTQHGSQPNTICVRDVQNSTCL